MKGNLKIIACITGTIAAVVTGIYASWKMNRKYREDRNFREEINAIPYERKK